MKLSKPSGRVNFPQLEEEVLAAWQKNKIFQKSLEATQDGPRFTFYDGPPFATGLPHYGHLLQGAIKDIIPRFKTMQGFYVERRFGWDCHGLPVEYELEKERGIRSRQEILEMGVDVFNDACRAIVLRHTKEWQQTTERLGRWVDFEHDYKTMDPDYMESIWWVVKTLGDKELLDEGRKAMHVCPRCATPLSNFEVAQSYRDRQDPAVYVAFPLKAQPNLSLIAWTTTPWTVPGNVLLAINPELTYVEVAYENRRYIVAESRVEDVFAEGYAINRIISADELIGQRYDPPFPLADLEGKHYEVVAADIVSADEGTGILHVAPAFGEEDLQIGEREQAAFVQHVDITGHITDIVDTYKGQAILDANKPIIKDLKAAGRLLRQESLNHSYPHCWRCDTPLMNYATASWFVSVSKLKPQLLKANQGINWVPEHVKDGRFGQWLEGARDWSISRNRFWGNPLPIWRCTNNHLKIIGSRDELEQLSGERPSDLHKQFVDKITFDCTECSEKMKRIPDVLDCWFESGSMPYAEQHYPFEHEQDFQDQFPADFIAEALDQTRGWFYTLHVLGVALKESRAFSSVITTGLVLAEDGKKMSKSLKNYPEPAKIFEQYGADAMRLYMVSSPIVRGDDLRFTESGVAEIVKNFNAALWNSYSFLATYAEIDNPKFDGPPPKPKHVLDQWILSRLQNLIKSTTDDLEKYDLMDAARTLIEFLEALSNWYIRRSRRRFWKSENDTDKAEAFATLHHVLSTFCQLAAPFAPFITDRVYQNLGHQKSVHLAAWPKRDELYVDEPLGLQMRTALLAVRLGLAARSNANVKTRQPLPEIRLYIHETFLQDLDNNIVQIIKDELNVKSVKLLNEDSELKSKFQPIAKEIAMIAGADTQNVIKAVKNGEYQLSEAFGETLVTIGEHSFGKEAFKVVYEPKEGFVVENDETLVVALNTKVSDELVEEGLANELTRHFQELRKSAGLEISDRIEASVQTKDTKLLSAFETHQPAIASEILARSLELTGAITENKTNLTIDGKVVTLGLRKVANQ